jgi:hypothetical protein
LQSPCKSAAVRWLGVMVIKRCEVLARVRAADTGSIRARGMMSNLESSLTGLRLALGLLKQDIEDSKRRAQKVLCHRKTISNLDRMFDSIAAAQCFLDDARSYCTDEQLKKLNKLAGSPVQ